MTQTLPLRQRTFPDPDPVATEILELQFATLMLELLISEFPPESPPFLARTHTKLVVRGQGRRLDAEQTARSDLDETGPRPPPV